MGSRTPTAEGRFLDYVRVLFTDAAVLQSFMSELPPGHVVCHDWDRLGDEDQASDIAAFISPNKEVAGWVESSLVDSVSANRGHDVDPLPFKDADAVASRLQSKLDAFEARYCGPKRSA